MEKLKCTLTPIATLQANLTTKATLSASLQQVNAIVKTDILDVSENGVYKAKDGYGYTKVTVDVPIPSNYGLITYNGSIITVS